mmetsp:Transcript_28615/g.25327  ORF Transcript_28615/g.25327 Transcript_28615/m.25327 type:complete len:111 (-) Transcript_28615:559-891(-)
MNDNYYSHLNSYKNSGANSISPGPRKSKKNVIEGLRQKTFDYTKLPIQKQTRRIEVRLDIASNKAEKTKLINSVSPLISCKNQRKSKIDMKGKLSKYINPVSSKRNKRKG